MHETSSGDGPALDDAREGDGAVGGQTEIVGGAEGEVGEELEVADAVGSQLEIAGWDAVGGCSTEGAEVGCLNGAGEADVGWGEW